MTGRRRKSGRMGPFIDGYRDDFGAAQPFRVLRLALVPPAG